MIKYYATAFALKAFSTTAPLRRLYRYLGNTVGSGRRARSTMPAYYFERVARILDLAQRHGAVRDGIRMLELGTGWMHWEALTARLFFDLRADLYDVWDNRQLQPLKSYLGQLQSRFDSLQGVTPEAVTRANNLVQRIKDAPDFEALYSLLGFRYVLDPAGMLADLPSASYNLVVSAGVFEHLPREGVPEYVRQTHRLLKPGGYAVHSINTTDHLHLYDMTASPKHYLRYSDRTWQLIFANEVQYINRLQRCEWMKIFADAGFVCIEENSSRCDLTGLRIHPQFQTMDRLSLETTSWCGVYQKPVEV